jgi:hypothetical protein
MFRDTRPNVTNHVWTGHHLPGPASPHPDRLFSPLERGGEGA